MFDEGSEPALHHRPRLRNGRASSRQMAPWLLLNAPGKRRHLMNTLRVSFLVIVTTTALLVGISTSLANPPHRHRPLGPVARPSFADGGTGRASSLDPEALRALVESGERHLDVYGNQIDDALTDYRI